MVILDMMFFTLGAELSMTPMGENVGANMTIILAVAVGVGIVFIIPISSVGSKKTLAYLTSGQEFVKGEESSLKDTKYELLVTIANQGYTDLVTDTAGMRLIDEIEMD